MGFLSFRFCFLPLILFVGASANATMFIRYDQSSNFWDVLDKIQNGVSTIDQANQLLNETYGTPVGAEVALVYRPDTFDYNDVVVREARVSQVGYAVSSNPVLPRLTGFEGQEIAVTMGWRFLEVYGGRVFGKSTDAVSTDLIDRRLVQSNNLTLFGAGIRYHYDLPNENKPFPISFEALTRDTLFFTQAGDVNFLNRWRLRGDIQPKRFDVYLIVGQNPIPDFDLNGFVWDYIWQIDLFPDALSLVGVGAKTPALRFWDTTLQVGFYGGYVGGEITMEPLEDFRICLHTYGLETTAAFQAQELRLWGASLSYVF